MITTPVYDWDTMLERAEQAEKTARAVLEKLSSIQVILPVTPKPVPPNALFCSACPVASLLGRLRYCLKFSIVQENLGLSMKVFGWFPLFGSRNLKKDMPNAPVQPTAQEKPE